MKCLCGNIDLLYSTIPEPEQEHDGIILQKISLQSSKIEYQFLAEYAVQSQLTILKCIFCESNMVYYKDSDSFIPVNIKRDQDPQNQSETIIKSDIFKIDMFKRPSQNKLLQNILPDPQYDQFILDIKSKYLDEKKEESDEAIREYIQTQRDLLDQLESKANKESILFLDQIHDIYYTHIQSNQSTPAPSTPQTRKDQLQDIFHLDEESNLKFSKYDSLIEEEEEEQVEESKENKGITSPLVSILATSLPVTINRKTSKTTESVNLESILFSRTYKPDNLQFNKRML